MREQFPDAHVLAVGDISQERGGQITQHRSHQSGRDVDIGLVYKHKPADFPENFVTATADNLDCEATYALLNEFAETTKRRRRRAGDLPRLQRPGPALSLGEGSR